MKIKLLFFALFIIVSCKKDDNNKVSSVPSVSNVAGTYVGAVTTYINGSVSQVLPNHTMIITDIGNGKASITSGNLIITSIGNVSGNIFTIPNTVAASGQGFSIVEYGSAILNGNQLSIDLNQENSGGVIGQWTGVLTKQ